MTELLRCGADEEFRSNCPTNSVVAIGIERILAAWTNRRNLAGKFPVDAGDYGRLPTAN